MFSMQIPVSTWGRLDVHSPWMEFHSQIDANVLRAVLAFAPDVVLGVDWSSFPVYQRIRSGFDGVTSAPPFVWLSYRIFTRTATDINAYRFLKQ